MPDYKTALEQGIAAAKKAAQARTEIKKVLGTFKDELLGLTDGKVLVEIKELYESEDAMEVLRRASTGLKRRTYQALVAYNPTLETPPVKELARWKQSENGYPCALVFGRQERQFENRAALEKGLSELLKDTRVGEVIYMLMNEGVSKP
jgi:hypothetical protein